LKLLEAEKAEQTNEFSLFNKFLFVTHSNASAEKVHFISLSQLAAAAA